MVNNMYLKYILIVFFFDLVDQVMGSSVLPFSQLYKEMFFTRMWYLQVYELHIFECTDWLKCLFWNSKVFLNNDLATEEVSLVNGLFDWNESFSGSIDVQV